jgi:DNA-directed RNA polymerase I subunit RPA2
MSQRIRNPPTSTTWSVEYETIRRQSLFQQAPRDHSAYPALEAAVRPHVDSFNALFGEQRLVEEGLRDTGIHTVVDGDPADEAAARNRLELQITDVVLEKPTISSSNKFSVARREIYPAECRERYVTYQGKLKAKLQWRINDEDWQSSWREMGQTPIMLKSNRCHIQRFTPSQLVHHKEESEEQGGYFIVNGIEKMIRMMILSRRNYPMAIARPAFAARGPTFTKLAVQMRCVRPDQTSQTNTLHYLADGNVTFRFSWMKAEYLIPIMMIFKALVETNDREIFEGIVGSGPESKQSSDSFVTDRLEALFRTYKTYHLVGRRRTMAYLGEKFRSVLQAPVALSAEEVGARFLRKIVLPHLGWHEVTEPQNNDKFQQLLFMTRKLYALAAGECAVDNPDAVSNQEVLLGGFLYGMILKERLHEWMISIGSSALQWSKLRAGKTFTDPSFEREFLPKIVLRSNEAIGRAMEHFLSTGNLTSPSGLELSQSTGFSVLAEKINFYRFISHFRMIHRGSFYAQRKTTAVRKLLPESWGFLCPVHTPDGAPCGLLSHLAHQCQLMTSNLDTRGVEAALFKLGISNMPSLVLSETVVVQLDGRVLGYCLASRARTIAQTLRYWKVKGENRIPIELEIGHVPPSKRGLYPGLFLFSQAARLMRPVRYLPLDSRDYVGPMEQPFMDIACVAADVIPGLTTHQEFEPTDMFSILANMTPFSDFNQSPRNMYQCQMSKQTMGTPGTSLQYRTDNKAYLLHTGQTPIARPPLYNAYGLDNYPNGMNAVVAVISYTGYDMDDAMIINKSSHERGFGDGVIYKTKKYSLVPDSRSRIKSKANITHLFGFAPQGDRDPTLTENLDDDGIGFIGSRVREGDRVLAYHKLMLDPATGKHQNLDQQTMFHRYRDAEEAYIDQVRLVGSETGDKPCQTILIKYRIPRRPVIGDKFSSRHGQKGVCSQLWPSIDMPFSETGIQPDVIINPHAFPSRMTIGMFIESLAGKTGALHGLAQDSTPFQFSEEHTAGDYFGHQLKAAGFNFHGNEPMYSGITGKEFAADIYVGLVYYQRLRHMVNDKFQVRSTGPVNSQTRQPVKGRSKGGGIRIGEMERDSLIAHGAAFLLQDRLMDCSDATRAWICRSCGSFLSTQLSVNPHALKGKGPARSGLQASGFVRCRVCAHEPRAGDSSLDMWEDGNGAKLVGGDDTTVVTIPGVLKFLDTELSSMGVKMRFGVGP